SQPEQHAKECGGYGDDQRITQAALNKRKRALDGMNLRDAIIIGVAQILALVPGTSRSGITMTAGFALNFTPQAAARFSFLLSIPVIVLAGGLTTLDLLQAPGAVDWQALVVGTALSAIVAYLTIAFFLRFISRIGMLPFMLYRLALAAVIIYLLLLSV
ncbi:MAG: undecaprenyl-diphosphate phosphatase, partial [Pseudomonadota bacterium]